MQRPYREAVKLMFKRSKPKSFPGVQKLQQVRKEVMALTPRARKRAKRRTAATWLATGLAAGGGLTYYFDPVRGAQRRALLGEKVASMGRRVIRTDASRGIASSGVYADDAALRLPESAEKVGAHPSDR